MEDEVMKRFLIGLVGIGALLWVAPALATVTVFATVDKDKDITINETITITKNVTLTADVNIEVHKAAESLAIANQDNFFNKACTNCAEKRDIVIDSFNDNSGVVDGNQAAGNMNNQGNGVSVAVDTSGGTVPPEQVNLDDPGFAESQAHAEQQNLANIVETVNLLFRDAEITGSLNDNTGVLGFNQSPGNMNNQVNLVSLAVALTDDGVALSEADLGQWNQFNDVDESDSVGFATAERGIIGIHKDAHIENSLNGNTGIAGVNQSAGNMANQANVVSMSFVSAQ
jgi:hypothetical protein